MPKNKIYHFSVRAVRYDIADHTADIMVRCYGSTVEECFANAAYALFDQMVDISAVDPVIGMEINAAGDDMESRLFALLSELLFIRDTESVVFSEFDVRFDGDRVRCYALGESFSAGKHGIRGDIKAITYHMLSVNTDEPLVTVIFDV